MKFCILGPMSVGPEVEIGPGGREARILGALLISDGRPVSVERLIDLLWESKPPATARRQVRNCAAAVDRALRTAHLPGLSRVPNGYRMAVNPGDTDASAFERRVEDGRAALATGDHATAAAALRTGLRLWRGEVLGGVRLGPFEGHAVRLTELRLAASEKYFAAEISLGRGPEITADLAAAIAAHPLREGLVALMMRVRVESGESAEALRLYGDTRRRLETDYGVSPSSVLHNAYLDVMRRTPSRVEKGDSRADAVSRAMNRLELARTDLAMALAAYVG